MILMTWLLVWVVALTTGLVDSIELPSKCGESHVSSGTSSSRIVGGQVAKLGQWPWQVYLNKTFTMAALGVVIQSDCGAAIVNKDWLLTAAHCVYDIDQGPNTANVGLEIDLEAVMGTVDLNTKSATEVRRKIVKAIRHEHFQYENKTNDIALLKMNTSLDFEGTERHLGPVCIPKPDSLALQSCQSVGFGYQDKEMLLMDNRLRNVAEAVVDHSKCNNEFGPYNAAFNLCVGGVGGKGTCKGDSGSPFVCVHSTASAKWYQTGVVSYGRPCALDQVPDVVTNVAVFHDWIVKQSA